MYDRSIAWMMSGGNRFDTLEERRNRAHARALREARAAAAERELSDRALSLRSLLSSARTALADFGIAPRGAASGATVECCVA